MNFFRSIISPRTLLPLFLGGIFLGVALYHPSEFEYYNKGSGKASGTPTHLLLGTSTEISLPEVPAVTHIDTPIPLKGVYMTSCIASGKNLRAPLVKLLDTTELNSVVIDIKDFTGMVSIDTGDPRFVINTNGCHIPDIKEFIALLHEKDIYVIGRVTVMQDQVYTKAHPSAAVKRKSDGAAWKDKKGLMFVDPGASEYWQYMVDLGQASYDVGFDEINYDYIRFPSDGDMANAHFARTGSTTKAAMMKRFYQFLGTKMHAKHIPISADLFGMTTTNYDDLGIGQVLEDALQNFDFVAPMVYPSHYPRGFNGWKDPNLVPYEIIKFAMSKGVERANTLEEKESGWVPPVTATSTASSTVKIPQPRFVPTGKYAAKLRPWIQDFNYGKIYTEADVRAQKKATYDSGLTSWLTWDPKNKYTAAAYDPARVSEKSTPEPVSVEPVP
jgi:hypothetical protein